MIFGRHINRYYWRYSPALLLGLLALAMVDYLQLIVPNLYQQVINGMNDGYVLVDGVRHVFDMEFLLGRICMPMVVVIACMVLGRFLWRVCIFGSAIKVEWDLRNRMFAHSLELSHQYYQVNKVGGLMSLFTNDLETVQDCYGSGFLMFFDALMLGVMAIVKMWRMSSVMTALSLIPMALLLATSTLIGKYMMKKWDLRQEAFSKLSDFSQESFSGIAVVKAFVKEARELWAFKKINKENEDANVEFTKASVLLRILVTLFVESVICVILGYGGYLVHQDVFNAGQLMEFIGYFTAIVWPIMAVSELIDMTSRGKASLHRISELLEAPVDVRSGPGAKIPETQGEITLEDVTFRHPGKDSESRPNALEHLTFHIAPGQHIGVVGKTGSGKTTLVDLLQRVYDIQQGTIALDGVSIEKLTLEQVRQTVGCVPQDNFLFADTIARNIAFSNVEAPQERIQWAAEMAGVHQDIVEFPQGYETMLGERGVTVSGGQKQRISIARALLMNPPVLILDDSLSAVDTNTERTILDNLRTIRQGKTTIVIAHRISTVESMDRILYLEQGRLVDQGTHQELCARCPGYRELVELQKLEEEGGGHHA